MITDRRGRIVGGFPKDRRAFDHPVYQPLTRFDQQCQGLLPSELAQGFGWKVHGGQSREHGGGIFEIIVTGHPALSWAFDPVRLKTVEHTLGAQIVAAHYDIGPRPGGEIGVNQGARGKGGEITDQHLNVSARTTGLFEGAIQGVLTNLTVDIAHRPTQIQKPGGRAACHNIDH